jgi:ABC-type phosphate transport system substrate-binding protein
MKTARFLLACAVASVLTACGTDTITAPDAARAPKTPAADETTSSTPCVTTTIVRADGSTVEVCVENTGSQMGSGY